MEKAIQIKLKHSFRPYGQIDCIPESLYFQGTARSMRLWETSALEHPENNDMQYLFCRGI